MRVVYGMLLALVLLWIGFVAGRLFGMVEGRQSAEVVACVETPNAVRRPERIRVVP